MPLQEVVPTDEGDNLYVSFGRSCASRICNKGGRNG